MFLAVVSGERVSDHARRLDICIQTAEYARVSPELSAKNRFILRAFLAKWMKSLSAMTRRTLERLSARYTIHRAQLQQAQLCIA